MSMNLPLDLTDKELLELRRHTNVNDDADAVSRAAREFLRICRARELTSIAGRVDYEENAWRALDQAELAQPELNIDP
jgi:hypothetical protein